jgi:diguanylate cyclase (GGDEF)-like protein/PAS domain S-box-containing protein
MLYNYGLLTNIKAIINYGYKKLNKIIVYSLLGLSLSASKSFAEDNILVIYSGHSELSSVERQQAAIEQGFAETGDSSKVFHEFFDSHNLSPKHGQDFVDYLERKYQRVSIDLLMVVEEPSLQLMLQQHDRFFPDVPVVFLGIDYLQQELLDTPWLTGAIENNSFKDTILKATEQMWTNSIIVIGNTTQNTAHSEQIEEIKKLDNKSLDVNVIEDLAVEDIKARLDRYPDHVPIFMLGQLRQNHSSPTLIDPKRDSQILRRQIPNPIYSNDAIRIGTGAVGGKIFDVNYHVRQAVGLAREVLRGVEPDELGPIVTTKNRWIFDYRQLLHYNINLNLLPENSEILYFKQPVYLQYKTPILIVALILLSCFLVIVFLIEKARKSELTNKILQENQERYKDLAKAGANVFWELDRELKYSYVSGDTEDLCGLKPAQMKGEYPPYLHQNNPQLNVDWELFERITQERQPLKNFTYTLRDCDSDRIRIFKVNGNPLFDREYNFLGYRGVKQEITAERSLYQKIAYQATYDDLTGLLNRREFKEKLKLSVHKGQQYNTESVLCYLDLDRFKIVNDTAGHGVGDRLLSELAQLLQNMIRKEDTLGRLGGDEFGLLLEGCSINEAEQICQQLIRAINNYRLRWKTIEFDVGVSIGMVGISDSTTDAVELLTRADLACYQAKNLGRGRVYIVRDNDSEVLQQAQTDRIGNVSQAIKEKRFYLVKQLIKPIANDSKVQHYELLLRLKDRSGNLIEPEEFIPAAERYGVITIVDRWVLEATLKAYTQYFASEPTLISINLSAASINDERFTEFAIDLIEKSAVPANSLCFEINEAAAITQVNQAQKFIAVMKNLGVKFALDDFGSGLSSLSKLKNLPVDYLKIDGSLIRAIPNEKYYRTIVDSINQVAHSMGIETIAEYVESDRILECLSEISIDYAQGYITGKPVAIAT